MIKRLLMIYMIGFTSIMIAAFFFLPNTVIFLISSYFILFVMGMAIMFIKSPIRECIIYFIICFVIVALGMYGIYKTSDFNDSKALFVLVVPILIASYRILKEDAK